MDSSGHHPPLIGDPAGRRAHPNCIQGRKPSSQSGSNPANGKLLHFQLQVPSNGHFITRSHAQLPLCCCHSVLSDSATPQSQATLSFTISQGLLKLMSIESVMPSSHLILCPPLLLQTSIFPRKGVFSNESALPIKWSKYRSFSISPSNEYSGLISFRIDFL